jgi:alkylation response protein AidB-like acyl-CoA dehydrogenase
MNSTITRESSTGTAETRARKMVEKVAPVLRDTAAASEAERRVAPAAMNALIDAGVLRAFLPTAYGGADLDGVTGLKMFEELAYNDSAAAWVGFISAAGAWLTVVLPPKGADELLADPRAVINGTLLPGFGAVPVEGGYRITGRTAFASGCEHATWLQCQAVIMENGAPKVHPNGAPAALIVNFPANEAEIIDTWRTLGMRGTGSHDFVVNDVFVPEHRVWAIGPYAPVNPAFTSPLAKLGIWWFSPGVATLALGIARAAVDDLIALAQAKTPTYTRTGLADKPVVQDKVARARAAVEAARAYVYSSLATAEEILRTEPKLTIEQGIPLALAGSQAIEASIAAVDLVHSCAGTSGIRNEQRFQQYFRDVHTISQHAFASPSRFESVGKLLLGRESDWPFYYM